MTAPVLCLCSTRFILCCFLLKLHISVLIKCCSSSFTPAELVNLGSVLMTENLEKPKQYFQVVGAIVIFLPKKAL